MLSTIKFKYRHLVLFILTALIVSSAQPVLAQATEPELSRHLQTLWLVTAGSLVFFMNAGFAMLEAGLCQTRNATNVLAKNLIVFCVSMLAFWILGFGLMFGDGNSWMGTTGFFFEAFTPPLQDSANVGFTSLDSLYPNQPLLAAAFFQLVFAGTTATIVSGAMAERVKFWAFFCFSFLLVAIAYPLTGRWIWHPEGWLNVNFNFLDFAGSTVIHSVGGMAGLVGTILIGPRRGWQGYDPEQSQPFAGSAKAFPFYSLSLSTLGCLILWLGWLGFNGGSVASMNDIPHTIMTTMLSGASGGVFVLLLRGLRSHKPALPLVINGILGGLVSITASSVFVSLAIAVLIGALSSLWIILGEKLLETLKIDDPVGAIPVHLGCGIWGTLAAGMFAHRLPPYVNFSVVRFEQIFNQIIGILAVNGAILLLSLGFWLAIGWFLYSLEQINMQLKSVPNPSSSPADEKQKLPPAGWRYYLTLARAGLRVSKAEEALGSDGTFS